MFPEQVQSTPDRLDLTNLLISMGYGTVGGAAGLVTTYYILTKFEIVDEKTARVASVVMGVFCAYYCVTHAPHI